MNRSGDLASVLEDIGVEIKRVSGDEIQGRCPLHHLTKGRSSTRFSWYMNTDTGLYLCHTCGSRGNLPMLIATLSGDDNAIVAVQSLLIRNGLDRLTAPQEREERVEVDWIRYSKFAPLPESVLERRMLKADVAHKFGVKWDKDKRMTIVPIVSQLGELLGWQAKRTGQFLNVPEGVHKGSTLFGIERAMGRTAVLLESPLDCVRFAGVYSDDDISPVSSFGANVSNLQIDLITSRFDRLIVAMDNDKAGTMEARRLAKIWPTFRKGIRYWKYGVDSKDIGDYEDDGTILRDLSLATVRCP